MSEHEINMDGLVGPTHNYSGLAPGNVASEVNKGSASHPRAAALQGLRKMQLLSSMGIPQMVMPPHPRPNPRLMFRLGFTGTLRQQIEKVAKEAPEMLPILYSSSGMWTANAATVAPGYDTKDGRVHFTPANLLSTVHRPAEAEFASVVLKRLFPNKGYFVHHDPLPSNMLFSDEGAANHMRLTPGVGKNIHVFVYGRSVADFMGETSKFPARQTLQASQAVARLHTLDPERTFFIKQNPAVIDQGVFHNDVIATSNGNLLLFHEKAFADGRESVEAMQRAAGGTLGLVEVKDADVSVEQAVKSYLFNSQIVTQGNGMVVIAPVECEESKAVNALLKHVEEDASNPIHQVMYVDLRESMQNGGGPACLRLRVSLTDKELENVHQPALMNAVLFDQLEKWVNKHYREEIYPADLADPALAEEAHEAYSALESILELPGIYNDDEYH